MDFCKIVAERGGCKKLEAKGLFRSINAVPGAKVGEYDLLLEDGFVMRFWDTKDEFTMKGAFEVTGQGEDDVTEFKVTGWNDPRGVWPSTWYGAYKLKKGGNQLYTFIEMATNPSGQPVHSLDDAFKGNGSYYVGVSCLDKDNCDFSKARPQSQTMASAYYSFLDTQFIQ